MSTNRTLRAVPTPTTDPAKPRTETEEKLWQALQDNPGSTAAALSAAAGIGKSTAPKILTRWDHLPTWDGERFVDPDTRLPLPAWADAVDELEEPAHVVSFGRQVHSKGILGGTEEAGRHIGYLTKYLTKATGEVIEAASDPRAHRDRLHGELCITPCSPRCAVWSHVNTAWATSPSPASSTSPPSSATDSNASNTDPNS